MTHKNGKGLAVACLFRHTNVGKGTRTFGKFPSGAVNFLKISVLFLLIRRITLRCWHRGYPTYFWKGANVSNVLRCRYDSLNFISGVGQLRW
jgi:hypothetical protein